MQKVNTYVMVTTKGGNTYTFEDHGTLLDEQSGQSAKRSLDQKTAIDTIDEVDGKRTFIPYEAIDHAVIEVSLAHGQTPQDANCVVKQDDAEPGTLTIFNDSNNIANADVALKIGQPGTYPGNGRSYAFTADVSDQLGNGWYSAEYPITINANGRVDIQEIPDGTPYAVFFNGENRTGTIPANVVISDSDSGGDPK